MNENQQNPRVENADEVVHTLTPLPGIKRDGTLLEGEYCADGQWVRFQRGKARKMGGYRRITDGLYGPARKFSLWSRKYLNVCNIFSAQGVQSLLTDNNMVGNDIADRTPSGFVERDSNGWTVDTQYDDAVATAGTITLAHCNQSMLNIDDDTASKPYWALANSATSQFAEIADAPAVSGGVFSLAPYTVLYGSDGFVAWSDVNQPQVWSGSANFGDAGSDRVTGSKIVAGLPLRSGKLAALLWSLDSVIRMDYVGGQSIFSFSTISTQSSILSQHSVIEYDGVYFWIGVDRFMYFDSSAHELPNDMSQNWFFDHLNYEQRQKVWVTKVPRFGEIWWFYPRGTATECTHAVIYNVRMKVWYDTELPRSAGAYSQVRIHPVWVSNVPEASGNYGLYQHEVGNNAVVGDNETAIYSSFTTQNFGLPTGGVGDSQNGANRWTRVTRVEPDFLQVGDMECAVLGYEYAQSAPEPETSYSFSPEDGKIDMREQRRHVLLRFESNVLNGYYEAGKVIIHTEPGDNRG